ncbi:12437_t:CDS:2, partial [Rhizophagus irregularis]
WFFKKEFVQAEEKRNKLIKSKKIGPEFAEKYHSKAIYTSRPLSALISKCLSTNSSSTISFGNNQEKDLDIDIERKRNNEELNLDTYDNSGKRIKTS